MIFSRMIQKAIFSFLMVGVFFALTACTPEAAEIHARRTIVQEQKEIVQPELKPDELLDLKQDPRPEIPAQELVWITQDGGKRAYDFNPRTDILFVVDDSDSMRSAQDNLSRNINRFVETFSKNRMIDFHIGVISTWENSPRFLQGNKSGYASGELRRLKNARGQQANQRFVTRFQGFQNVLASTLKVGVTPFAEGGPEVEEFFTPIADALTKTGRGAANEGFFREDAHLVIVLVTDADDASPITAREMADKLFAFKGGDKKKVSAYGVLVRKNDPDSVKDWGLRIHPKYSPQCFDFTERKDSRGRVTVESKNNGSCKEGFGPEKLDEFIVEANAEGRPDDIKAQHILKLNQRDFGSDLAKIGSHITLKVLEKEILLNLRPRVDSNGRVMVRVRYGTPDVLAKGGGVQIPNQSKGGWLYDPKNNSVKIAGDVQYEYVEGAGFAVDMVPLNY